MTNFIIKTAVNKALGEHQQIYKNKNVTGDDPFFDTIIDRRGRKKKVKKIIPDYIPEHDAEILREVRSRAYHLDCALFNFLGIRFGWSSVIGLIPEIGDFIDLFFAVRLYSKINRVDCPIGDVRKKMKWNIFADFALGLVPFIGDLADGWYKCNGKNAQLLAEAMERHYAPKALKRDKKALYRRSHAPMSDDPNAALDAPEDADGATAPRYNPASAPPRYNAHDPAQGGGHNPRAEETQSSASRGWFSGWFGGRGSRAAQADEEMGEIPRR